jgi:hypothetical protein
MSSVHAVQPAAPTTAEPPTFLTPESLVTYCDTRVSSLDLQMQEIFNQQQANANTETALSNLASELNDLPQPSSSSGSNPTIQVTVEQFQNLEAAYGAAIQAAGPSTTLGQQLFADENTLAKAYGQTSPNGPSVSLFATKSNENDTYSISESTITNLSQNLKTYSSNLDSDSQMQMINLQSMMSQQQTAVELSTNLLQTSSQTTLSIASNCKAS